MKNYRNYEELAAHYSVETEAIERTIIALEKAQVVIKQFDGKIFNVKLEKAMKEAVNIQDGGKISVHVQKYAYGKPESMLIQTYSQIYKHYGEPDKSGYRQNVSPSIYGECRVYDVELLNGRVMADAWNKAIDKRIEELDETWKQLQKNNDPKIWDEMEESKAAVIAAIEAHNAKLDFVAKNAFEVERRY